MQAKYGAVFLGKIEDQLIMFQIYLINNPVFQSLMKDRVSPEEFKQRSGLIGHKIHPSFQVC